MTFRAAGQLPICLQIKVTEIDVVYRFDLIGQIHSDTSSSSSVNSRFTVSVKVVA